MSQQEQEFDLDDELGANDTNEVEPGAVADEDPFNDDMDDLFMEEDTNEISISKIKAMTGFVESDKDDIFVGVDKARKMVGLKPDPEDDTVSVSSLNSQSHPNRETDIASTPAPLKIPFTEPQLPFQPSSSPVHLQHRFMVWNTIGIIRNYEVEDDDADAIDIEFHDVSFHNGIHMRNTHDYSLAVLGKDAAVFASSTEDAQSKINCVHYSSWDNTKEWFTDLPKHEVATTLAIGSGWFAVGTSLNRVRIFSIGGVQRNIFDVGGQFIAISGNEDLLIMAYHTGIGLQGNQCVSYSIIRIRGSTGLFPLISNEALPLSPKSELTWIGFSDEGTPAFSDSTDTVRILQGRFWTPFLQMKDGIKKNGGENYWVTGLSVCSQHVRAIKCKGTSYPPTLPRPNVILLDAKMPLCEMETEKSQLEDVLLRSIMLSALTKKMDKKGFDVENYKDTSEKEIKEILMKLFGISCKGARDFRACEYVSMMPTTHSIQVAIKFANKLRKMALTDRLTAIGRRKLDEEEEGLEEYDDDFESMRTGTCIYSSVYSTIGATTGAIDDSFVSSAGFSSNQLNRSADVVILEENPLLARQRAEIQAICSSSVYKNPFKRDSATGNGDSTKASSTFPKDTMKESENPGKGLALIDAWKKPVEKPSIEFNPKHPTKGRNSKKAVDKDKSDKEKGKRQPTLFALASRNSFGVKDKKPMSPEIEADENSNASFTIEDGAGPEESVETNKKKRKQSGDAAEAGEKKTRISSKLSIFTRRVENTDNTDDVELEDI